MPSFRQGHSLEEGVSSQVEELKLLSTAEKLGLLSLAEKALTSDPGAITSASLLPLIAGAGAQRV